MPAEEIEKEQRYFTPDESQRIIDSAPEPWNICFAFMAYLGVRTSKLWALPGSIWTSRLGC
jgi:hypothetical protein